MTGLLVLNKPGGVTSFGAVARVRRLCGERRAGHCGTLDPMATGVLPIFLGRATRVIPLLPCGQKAYFARLRLGVNTDTGDSTGRVTRTRPVTVGAARLRAALPAFTGDIMQVPPMFSALHVGGERLYDIARRGETVERAPRPVTIHSLELAEADDGAHVYALRVGCSAGTYIRTLIEDIGEALGCGAVMTALARTAAAGFSLAQARTLEELETAAQAGKLQSEIQSVESVFINTYSIPLVAVTAAQAARFGNGGALARERLNNAPQAGLCRVYDPAGVFLGLAHAEKEELRAAWLAGAPG